jgi:hypothetical protein
VNFVTDPGRGRHDVGGAGSGMRARTVVPAPGRLAGRRFDDLATDARAWLYRSAGRAFDLDFAPADALELTSGGKGRFVVSSYRP